MITFSSVTKAFQPDSTGIFDLSFHIEPGEMVFVTGPSGSGKTTLMRLLTREYAPSEGEIEFDGIKLSTLRDRDLHTHRRKIGVIFQDYRLLPELNIWENVALPLSIIGKNQHEIEERVTDLLKLVQLTSKAELFPRQLSGGEAQRISIARALAMAPSVICADEPTGNLDRETASSIAHLLHTINKLGTTIIFATHDPSIISLFADKRRINLEGGKLTLDTKEQNDSTATKTKKPTAETKSKVAEVKEDIVIEEIKDSPEIKVETQEKQGFFAKWFGKKKQTKQVEPEVKPEAQEESKEPEPKKAEKKKTQIKVHVESLDEDEE